jgi:hypothetical protein
LLYTFRQLKYTHRPLLFAHLLPLLQFWAINQHQNNPQNKMYMKQFSLFIALLVSTMVTFAQAPQSINYQGVARNAGGAPYSNQQISVRLSIHTETADGPVEYNEVRNITTNAFGLFTVQIGSSGALSTQGNFSAINWASGKKYLQTEISLPTQNGFTDLGTTQMMSVPFAIHSVQSRQLVFPFDTTITTHSKDAFTIKNTGVYDAITGSATKGYGVVGQSDSASGVFGYSLKTKTGGVSGANNTNGGYGVYGYNGLANTTGAGVYGYAPLGVGVKGESLNHTGVVGTSENLNGVNGYSKNGIGVIASSLNYYAISGFSEKDHGVVGLAAALGKAGIVGSAAYNGTIGVLAEGHENTTALVAQGSPTGMAAEINGRIKIHGTGQVPADGKVLTSDATGNASWQYPKTIAFRASGLQNNANQSIAENVWKKVLFYQEARYNEGNSYDAPNAFFFPTVTGIYHLNTQVRWVEPAQICFLRIMLLRNGQTSVLAEEVLGNSLTDVYDYKTSKFALDIRLQQNDAVWVEARQSNTNNSVKSLSAIGYETWFTGHLITRL